jgi:hypothetical protein
MSRGTDTTRNSPRIAVSKFCVFLGAITVAGGVGLVIPAGRFHMGILITGAACIVVGGSAVINALLGNPLNRRFPAVEVSRLLAGTSTLASGLVGIFTYPTGIYVLAVSGSLTGFGCLIIITSILGNPPRSFRFRDLPSKTPWRAAGRGAAPTAGAGLAARAGWRAMRITARLMPPVAGRRWLAEAESFLTEAPPGIRRRAVRSYLAGAVKVLIMNWAAALARLTGRGPTPR